MPLISTNSPNHSTFWAGRRWKDAFGLDPYEENRSVAELDRQPVNYSSDLQDLIALIRRAGRRLLANDFLNRWLVWISWISLGLVIGAAISKRLTGVLVAAVVLLASGATIVFARAWSKRSNEYGVACKLDEASGL